MALIRSETTGAPAGRYPWPKFKARLFDNNERGKKLNGLKRDKAAFRQLERFYLAEYRKPLGSPADVNREVLGKFLAARMADGAAASTRKREAGSIKAAMRWAESCQPPLRPVDDWRRVKLPKVGKRRPHHHSRAELVQLLRSLRPGRWLTLAWIGARAGLRRGELLHLTPGDVKLERGVIVIVGKDCDMCAECRQMGGRWEPKDVDEREVPLLDDLAAYLRGVWPTIRGQRWVLGDERPSLEELSTYFARLTRKAGLRGGPQTLRHTFGSHMADDGVPMRTLQEWMGHENLDTTMQYTSTAKSDADHARKARPLDV